MMDYSKESMDYNKQRHKQLLKRSQDLKTEGKNLFIENPEEDFELLQYTIVVEEYSTFKIDLKRIEKFQPSIRSYRYRFASLMCAIFHQFEEVEDEYSTEQEVKDYVKEVNINNN